MNNPFAVQYPGALPPYQPPNLLEGKDVSYTAHTSINFVAGETIVELCDRLEVLSELIGESATVSHGSLMLMHSYAETPEQHRDRMRGQDDPERRFVCGHRWTFEPGDNGPWYTCIMPDTIHSTHVAHDIASGQVVVEPNSTVTGTDSRRCRFGRIDPTCDWVIKPGGGEWADGQRCVRVSGHPEGHDAG